MRSVEECIGKVTLLTNAFCKGILDRWNYNLKMPEERMLQQFKTTNECFDVNFNGVVWIAQDIY